MMAKRQRAVEIAKKLPLADLLPGLNMIGMRRFGEAQESLDCSCGGHGHGHVSREPRYNTHTDQLLAENDRLRRALADLTSQQASVQVSHDFRKSRVPFTGQR